MSRYSLIIGNKNYSSWSLRPWLVLKHIGVELNEIVIPLYQPDSKDNILKVSKAGLVPVLEVDGQPIWDSLAICEFLNERHPDAKLWPEDPMARAMARSISSEMHAGFKHVRSDMPMNMRRHVEDFHPSPLCQGEIRRAFDIFTTCRKAYGAEGAFLFGHFTIADAMFAPLLSRFDTYAIPLPEIVKDYSDSIMALPAFQEWKAAAMEESWSIPEAEIYP